MLQIVGQITPPPGVSNWIGVARGGSVPGLVLFLTALIKLAIVIAGLYAFVNLLLAGYQFMSAGGDPKSVEKAWNKIWQSLVGLLIVAGSFVIIAIISWVIFKDPLVILAPAIYKP